MGTVVWVGGVGEGDLLLVYPSPSPPPFGARRGREEGREGGPGREDAGGGRGGGGGGKGGKGGKDGVLEYIDEGKRVEEKRGCWGMN